MVKYIVIFFNLIGIVGFNLGLSEPVTVEINAPENAMPGSSFTVEVKINKSDVDGFAKFQQEWPEGFTVEKGETSNATFSFKDQVVKCLWMAIPESESFVISYTVTIAPSVSGLKTINGAFSYIDNNEKMTAEVPAITIQVGEKTMAIAESKNPVENKVPAPAPPSTPNKRTEENGVLCLRTISPVKGKQEEFKVEIKIKSNKSGFAKIDEYIPAGFTATEIESMEGMFSFKNNNVKIIWMSLPPESEFNLAYKLTAGPEVTGNQKIHGTFSYIEGNSTQKFDLTPSNIFIEKDENGIATIIIDDEGGTFSEKEEVAEVPEEFSIPKPEDDDGVKSFVSQIPEPEPEPEPIKTEEPKEEIAKVPEPESDVIYRVQIAAGHQSVPKDYFLKKYQLGEQVGLENHEGWIKYTIGSFREYKDSRNKRNEVWNKNKIKDAFVSAYNYGNRITVQEALMATNQKWIN